jgi:hypothetical protein
MIASIEITSNEIKERAVGKAALLSDVIRGKAATQVHILNSHCLSRAPQTSSDDLLK